MLMDLEFHEIADAFLMFKPAALAELAESVAHNGLRDPIVLFEGKILDGRNRYSACLKAGVKLGPDNFIEFEGDWKQAVSFVTDKNQVRRHATRNERALSAAKLAELGRGRPSKENSANAPFSNADAAAQMDVSQQAVKHAKSVLSKGTPELVEAVAKEEVSLGAASEVAKLPAQEQQRAVAGGRQGVAQAAKKSRQGRKQSEVAGDIPMSDAQRAVRRKAQMDALFLDLLKIMTQAKSLVSALADAGVTASPKQREIGVELAQQFITIGEWLKTLFTSEKVSDEALSAWLSQEES